MPLNICVCVKEPLGTVLFVFNFFTMQLFSVLTSEVPFQCSRWELTY